MKQRKCTCGKKFTPKRDWQKFHSPACRYKAWVELHPRITVAKEKA